MNFRAVCDALGARFAAGTLGTPPGTPTPPAIRAVYPQSLKAAPSLPAVILEPQDGDVTPNNTWEHDLNIDVLLVLAKRPADPDRVEAWRQAYLPYLLHATVDQPRLGIGAQAGWEVKSALPTGWEYDLYRIGDVEYDAIRVAYQVKVRETVTFGGS